MKTNTSRMLKIVLSLLLNSGCVLAMLPVQAQIVEQDRIPISAKAQALTDKAAQLSQEAALSLHAGNFAEAEAQARQAKSVTFLVGIPQAILAASLEAQGKNQEALEAYHEIVVVEKSDQLRDLLPYALLLLKSGQWPQAVAVYNQALSHLPDIGSHPETPVVHDRDFITAISHFSPEVPEPAALATAIHITRGMVFNATPGWAGNSQDTEAMAEYGKALQLAPNNGLANYYYGVGWQKLSPTDRAKFGTAQQVKADLQKAVKIGDARVKAAAKRALKDMG